MEQVAQEYFRAMFREAVRLALQFSSTLIRPSDAVAYRCRGAGMAAS
jgi:hypothetical protein